MFSITIMCITSLQCLAIMIPDKEMKRMEKQKTVTKDLNLKLATQRLSVLQLAEALGNVSEACRHSKMDRTSFYEWKRRFQTTVLRA